MFKKIIKKCTQSQVSYRFYNSITDIPTINWKDLGAHKSTFFSVDYLKTLESTLDKKIDFTYIVFFNTEQVVIGFAITQLITLNTSELQDKQFPCIVGEGLKGTLLKNLDVTVRICGNLFSCGEHGFVFNQNKISPTDAYECLAKALRDTRKKDSIEKPSFILVKEFWPESFKDSDAIMKKDFREFSIDVNMSLQLNPDWQNFDDYLASMRTKFRTRAKKVLNNSEAIVVKNFSENDIHEHLVTINTLYSSVIENAYFKIGQLDAGVFRSLKACLKNKFIFKGYFLNEELIGFTTSFIQETAVEAFHIGFDYSYKNSHNIYQRMLYDYVDLAIKQKVSQLNLGRTAETIKSCVGAKPIEMKLYIRHRNSVSNTLLKPFIEMVTPNNYEIRNPFKKTT